MNLSTLASSLALSAAEHTGGGEANLILPDLSSVSFLGLSGKGLLSIGILVSLAGLAFGLSISRDLKNLPVHRSMLEISELIYETCKTYLVTQAKFIAVLWAFIAVIMVAYFGFLTEPHKSMGEVGLILLFSVIGILGSTGVAWFGIRVNTYANSRSAFASLRGKPFPTYAIPLKAGMSIGASALRIAGGIFTKIADIGSDLMKIVFKIKEDDARNPGVIADCTGDNAGDSVGPTADGFETYGVTGVALITFILLAIPPEHFLPAG